MYRVLKLVIVLYAMVYTVGCVHAPGLPTPDAGPPMDARAIAATSAGTIGAVALATATALVAVCRATDDRCQKAIAALQAIGVASTAAAPAIAPPSPSPAPIPAIPAPAKLPCVAPQTGRTLLPGESFCPDGPQIPAGHSTNFNISPFRGMST